MEEQGLVSRMIGSVKRRVMEPKTLNEILYENDRINSFRHMPDLLERSNQLMEEFSELNAIGRVSGKDYQIEGELAKRLQTLYNDYWSKNIYDDRDIIVDQTMSKEKARTIQELSKKILLTKREIRYGHEHLWAAVQKLGQIEYTSTYGYQKIGWPIKP